MTVDVMPAPRLLLGVEAACRVLSVSRSSLYQLRRAGELRPVRIGRSVRFSVAELERFVTAVQERDGKADDAGEAVR